MMNDQLEITYRGTVQLLDVNDIQYIKSDNVYVEIFTEGHRYIQRKFLGQISEELPSQFVRIHRSYLINMDHVTQRKKNFVMIEDHKIPVSRKFDLEEIKISENQSA
jgi:two-component system response regulator LytT